MARRGRGPSPFVTTDSSMPIETQRSIRRLEQRQFQLGQAQRTDKVVGPTGQAAVGLLPNANPLLAPQLVFLKGKK